MSTATRIPIEELEEVPPPYPEPQLGFLVHEPRKVDNLTLIDGKTFLSTTVAGDIVPAGAPDVGFFHDDTRFLSHLELRINGQPSIVLSSNTERSYVSQIELTTEQMKVRDSFEIAENTIHIRRQQLLNGEALFDRFSLMNFNDRELNLSLALSFEADFVDVFQVRGTARPVHGQYYRPVRHGHCLSFFYRGLDTLLRETRIEMKPAPDRMEEKTAIWDIQLSPMKHWQIEVVITPIVAEEKQSASCEFGTSLRERRQRFSKWENSS